MFIILVQFKKAFFFVTLECGYRQLKKKKEREEGYRNETRSYTRLTWYVVDWISGSRVGSDFNLA